MPVAKHDDTGDRGRPAPQVDPKKIVPPPPAKPGKHGKPDKK